MGIIPLLKPYDAKPYTIFPDVDHSTMYTMKITIITVIAECFYRQSSVFKAAGSPIKAFEDDSSKKLLISLLHL